MKLSSSALIGTIQLASLGDARRKLVFWRCDYDQGSSHASLGNKTPAEARRALKQFEGYARASYAHNETQKFEIQTRKLSLCMWEPRGPVILSCCWSQAVQRCAIGPEFRFVR